MLREREGEGGWALLWLGGTEALGCWPCPCDCISYYMEQGRSSLGTRFPLYACVRCLVDWGRGEERSCECDAFHPSV